MCVVFHLEAFAESWPVKTRDPTAMQTEASNRLVVSGCLGDKLECTKEENGKHCRLFQFNFLWENSGDPKQDSFLCMEPQGRRP